MAIVSVRSLESLDIEREFLDAQLLWGGRGPKDHYICIRDFFTSEVVLINLGPFVSDGLKALSVRPDWKSLYHQFLELGRERGQRIPEGHEELSWGRFSYSCLIKEGQIATMRPFCEVLGREYFSRGTPLSLADLSQSFVNAYPELEAMRLPFSQILKAEGQRDELTAGMQAWGIICYELSRLEVFLKSVPGLTSQTLSESASFELKKQIEFCKRFKESTASDFVTSWVQWQGQSSHLEQILQTLKRKLVKTAAVGGGVLEKSSCFELGLTGPLLRSCGWAYDKRPLDYYELYKDLRYRLSLGTQGGHRGRLSLAIEDAVASWRIIGQAGNLLSEGGWRDISKWDELAPLPAQGSVYLTSMDSPLGEVGQLWGKFEDDYFSIPLRPEISLGLCATNSIEGKEFKAAKEGLKSFHIWEHSRNT